MLMSLAQKRAGIARAPKVIHSPSPPHSRRANSDTLFSAAQNAFVQQIFKRLVSIENRTVRHLPVIQSAQRLVKRLRQIVPRGRA